MALSQGRDSIDAQVDQWHNEPESGHGILRHSKYVKNNLKKQDSEEVPAAATAQPVSGFFDRTTDHEDGDEGSPQSGCITSENEDLDEDADKESASNEDDDEEENADEDEMGEEEENEESHGRGSQESGLRSKADMAYGRQSQGYDDRSMPPPKNEHLQHLSQSEHIDVQTLEIGVEEGIRILAKLEEGLTEPSRVSRDATQWLNQVRALRHQDSKGRTVIGVVGSTGAGKSSVINAVLDEERLVPTNGMRACTAVVTEISWNDSDDPSKLYRARIEFVTAQDWKRELEVLFKDLIEANGDVSRECTNADSEAGVAYAKIKSVYPQLTKEMMAEQNVEGLLQYPSVRHVLGTTTDIDTDDPVVFYRQLQKYVDSKEIARDEDGRMEHTKKKKSEPKKMEHWPLIRVVKLYTKSDALSTGAVIVDLPGVQDSNAARVADSLPVFCVSSRAYQKLCGRLKEDSPKDGFKTTEQTEVPQLQAHCKKLTEATRVASSRDWLNNLNMLLNSLSIWSSWAPSSGQLTARQRQRQNAFLREQLQSLEKQLRGALNVSVNQMSQDFDEHICNEFKAAAKKAQKQALDIAGSWGAPVPEGGLYFATYKALVRRDGVHTGKYGPRDLNSELAEPMLKQLGTGWEKAFQQRLPKTLQDFTTNAAQILEDFHAAVTDHITETGFGIAALGMLANQLETYSQRFQALADGMQTTVVGKQRTASREFVPVVTTSMTTAYEICANESVTRTLFHEATEVVRSHLKDICSTISKEMRTQMKFVIEAMTRDYETAFGAQRHIRQSTPEIEANRTLKLSIANQILGTHEVFRAILGAEAPATGLDQTGEQDQDIKMEDCDQKHGYDATNTSSSAAIPKDNVEAAAAAAEISTLALSPGQVTTVCGLSPKPSVESVAVRDAPAVTKIKLKSNHRDLLGSFTAGAVEGPVLPKPTAAADTAGEAMVLPDLITPDLFVLEVSAAEHDSASMAAQAQKNVSENTHAPTGDKQRAILTTDIPMTNDNALGNGMVYAVEASTDIVATNEPAAS